MRTTIRPTPARSDYACILSRPNASAIFCPYIIVRKVYMNRFLLIALLVPAVKMTAFYRRGHALLLPAFKMSAFYPRLHALFVRKKNINLIFGARDVSLRL